MTTDRQVEANRQNSAKSTGPKTPAGKLVASGNAAKHGLLAHQLTLRGESREAFIDLLTEVAEALKPLGPVEEILVQRIAIESWRLRRSSFIEAGIVESVEDSSFISLERSERSVLGGVFRSASNELLNLRRYEMASERSFFKALHELQRLQAGRKGDNVPTPLAVDLYGSEVV